MEVNQLIFDVFLLPFDRSSWLGSGVICFLAPINLG